MTISPLRARRRNSGELSLAGASRLLPSVGTTNKTAIMSIDDSERGHEAHGRLRPGRGLVEYECIFEVCTLQQAMDFVHESLDPGECVAEYSNFLRNEVHFHFQHVQSQVRQSICSACCSKAVQGPVVRRQGQSVSS